MPKSIKVADVNQIIFACEAGIGSSLMSVNALKKKLKAAKIENIDVFHKATNAVPADAKLILCHKGIKKSVQAKAPDAVIVSFNFFFNDPVFDQLVKTLKSGEEIVEN
ncbi:MAG: PTS lactose transporter subunit IIB [Anaerolineaceae bacterium]|jgi:mannitol-specific phosphotransferase system IIBC component